MMDSNPQEHPVPVPAQRPRRNPLRRLGCGLALIVWFGILLIPGFLLMLAMQEEVAIWHGGDFPEREYHPALQISLLMDIDTRGVNITRSYIATSSGDTAACVETQVSYVLWQGRGDPATYCDCYTRATAGEAWTYTGTEQGRCGAANATDGVN